MNSDQKELLIKSIQGAHSVLLVLSSHADEDEIAAGCSLYLALTNQKKSVYLVSEQEIKVGSAHLIGVNKITNSFGNGKKLIVSFPYSEETIEKASYDIKNGRLSVIVEGRGTSLGFGPEEVEYSFAESAFDLLFCIGVDSPQSLGEMYIQNQKLFSHTSIVNIDKDENNTKYGTFQLISKSPISQTVAWLLKGMNMPIDQDIASNLYSGMMSVYSSLALESFDPDVLEILAYLLRNKARKLSKNQDEVKSKEHAVFNTQENKITASLEGAIKAPSAIENETPEDWLRPKVFTTDKTPEIV